MNTHLYLSVITKPQNGSGWKEPLVVLWSPSLCLSRATYSHLPKVETSQPPWEIYGLWNINYFCQVCVISQLAYAMLCPVIQIIYEDVHQKQTHFWSILLDTGSS